MNSLAYHTDYWGDRNKKERFIHFLDMIHNLNLTRWDNAGYWDNNYRPFSYFDGDKLVASVCVYSLDMVIKGKPAKIAQISGVGTDPDYRRRGLSYELSLKAMAWADERHDFYFLFADEEAKTLYRKCGFMPVREQKTEIVLTGFDTDSEIKKLDMAVERDRQLVYALAQERCAVSDELGIVSPKLFMFWCLYFLKEMVYYIKELDIVVLMERRANKLSVYDIVGRDIPAFDVLYGYLAKGTDQSVEFLFMPDKLGIGGYAQTLIALEEGTFVKKPFPFFSSPFQFPLTAHA